MWRGLLRLKVNICRPFICEIDSAMHYSKIAIWLLALIIFSGIFFSQLCIHILAKNLWNRKLEPPGSVFTWVTFLRTARLCNTHGKIAHQDFCCRFIPTLDFSSILIWCQKYNIYRTVGVCESRLMPRSAVLSLHYSFPSLWEPSLKINISPFVSMATVLHFTECSTRVGGSWKWHWLWLMVWRSS